MPAPSANDLALVALPTELIQNIGSHLTNDALLMLRVTSKTLEAATHKEFIARYVAVLHCWMFNEQRWDRIDNILHTRFGEHVTKVVFTAEFMEHKSLAELPVAEIQLINVLFGPNGDLALAQAHTAWPIAESDVAPISRPLIAQLFRELKVRDIAVHLDFGGSSSNGRSIACSEVSVLWSRDVLTAAAITKNRITGIFVTPEVVSSLYHVIPVYSKELLQALSTVRELYFRGPAGPAGWQEVLRQAAIKRRI